jgi:hypothetical protein
MGAPGRVSAQELCQSRWCIAANCPNDAEPSGYCRHCEARRRRGVEVALHRVEQPRAPDPATELWCPACQQWLGDDLFGRSSDPSAANRRQRRGECRACSAKRRVRQRAALTPDALQALLDHDRARAIRRRARERGQQ